MYFIAQILVHYYIFLFCTYKCIKQIDICFKTRLCISNNLEPKSLCEYFISMNACTCVTFKKLYVFKTLTGSNLILFDFP